MTCGDTVLSNSPKRSGTAQPFFLAIATSFSLLAGQFFTAVPVAEAGQDEARVTIAPVARSRPLELTARPDSIRVDVNLVLIPVTVTDRYERPIKGLQKTDFHLFDNGAERDISQFFHEELPISLGIVFDASASMRGKMEQALRGVREFLKLSMVGDEFFLMKFSDRPESISGFTTDQKDIEDRLSFIHTAGWTALFDAIHLGVNQMKHATYDRKALLVLSDGGDNNSRYTEKEIKAMVRESDVRIFSISILDRSPSLDAISEESGGRAYRVHKIEDLPDVVANISAELHSEYVLGFTPPGTTNDGLYRKVKVELAQPPTPAKFRVSWKRGYYSPTP